jgi:hypothetical protein
MSCGGMSKNPWIDAADGATAKSRFGVFFADQDSGWLPGTGELQSVPYVSLSKG